MGPILFPLRRPAPILFLKAIKSGAGYALYGHPPRWHKVGPDKPAPVDAHHVATSHYHALAVKKLHADPAFHELAPHEQVHKVKGLAAEMQSAASASAAVSTWKKQMLAGQHPTPAQWKAFNALPPEKQAALLQEVGAKAPEPEKPASPNPWTDEQWAEFYLLPTNSNAPSHNKKIDALKNAADAGDVAAIQAMKFGSNTYGKKQALVAQHLLEAMGGGAASAPAAADAPKVVSVAPAPAPAAAPADISPAQEAGLIGWINAGRPPKSWSNIWKTLSKDQKKQIAEKASSAKPAAQPAAVDVPAVVHTFENPDAGIAAFVSKNADDKWAVSLKDTDAGEFLPTVNFYPTEAAAIESAKSAAGLKSRAPKVASVSAKKPSTSAVAPPGAVTLHNTSENHNKFYSAWVVGSTVHSNYGKIGTVGQSIAKEYDSPEQAHAALAKLINSKTAKGYKKVSGPSSIGTPADTGPKEGDTKQGADGMLVLKDGHWVKVGDGDITPGAKAAIDSMSLSQLKTIVQHADDLPPETAAYLKQKLAADAPSQTQPSSGPANIDGWKQVGGQMGSNNGGLFEAPDGTKWYCKFPPDSKHAQSELLAAALYEAAGVDVPHTKPIMRDGQFGIASKWQDGLQTVTAAKIAKAKGAHAGFAVDAWLANYDAVGLANDNMQVSPDGKAVRVDVGGSLEYRAQGKKKEFGTEVKELASMRDSKVNPKAAAVFGKMTEADIAASVAKVAAVPDDMIQGLVDVYAPGTSDEKAKLAATLIARKNDLLKKYPSAATAKKKRMDPTKLKVPPSKLPKPHDFSNWNGQGKGLSSHEHVNAANNAVEQEALALALKGNLPNLKAFQYHQIDKETGKPTGATQPIAQHPSKHVVQYHADLVQALDEIANPPQPLKLFRTSDATSVTAINSAFPPKAFGTTVGAVKSNEKLGFWVVLGGVTSIAKLKPAKTSHLSSAAVAAAHEKHKQASKLAKHFVSSVQSSGSYNDLFRDGKTHDHSGNALADVAKAALEHATSQPEGTTVYRWQNMSDAMVQKMLTAPEGTVIQATGPMCTSYSPTATTGFGKHRVMITYAQGAKAVESFGSGKYASEKEITTLPNARFVLLSREMVEDKAHGHGKRLDLHLLMLPPDLGIPDASK